MKLGMNGSIRQTETEDALPVIQKLSFRKEEQVAYNNAYAKLVFMLEGSLLLSLENKPAFLLQVGQVVFIPPHTYTGIQIREDVELIINRISDCMGMCNQIGLTKKRLDCTFYFLYL